MIPCRLNLLSPEKRRHLNSMIYFQFAKSILEILLIVISCSAIFLIGIQQILEDYYYDLTSTIAFSQNQHTKSNLEVKNINENLSEIAKIQKEYQPISPVVHTFINAIPEGIILNDINISLATKITTIAGIAKNRDSLLGFKKILEANPQILTAELPISQLTKKDSLPFSISLKLK